jgi:hypothetical protein
MRPTLITSILLSLFVCDFAGGVEPSVVLSGEKKRNNLVSELLEVSSISKTGNSLTFTRSRAGWVFVSAAYHGRGAVRIVLDKASGGDPLIIHDADGDGLDEAVRYVPQGEHQVLVECEGDASVDKLVVKAIPELIHCGLGFNPAIKCMAPFQPSLP